MPIYEYECPTHGRYEVSQRISEDALSRCNKAGCEQPVRKLISSTSFALKGGGWYSDGYGSSGGGSGGGGKSEASGAGACGAPACATGCASAKAEA